jgi:putative intracellular protease/amidase
MGGLRATPDASLAEAMRKADALVVAGGTVWRSPEAPDIVQTLREAAASGKIVAGICEGTRALAGAGLLNGADHTSNDAETLAVPGYKGAARFRQSAKALRDGAIVTAPGTAPVSFAAEVPAALGLGGGEVGHSFALYGAEHQAA